jgi:hypothetical protein
MTQKTNRKELLDTSERFANTELLGKVAESIFNFVEEAADLGEEDDQPSKRP